MLTVFCSISEKEIKQATAWLIPSLEKQKNIDEINLYLINYSGTNSLGFTKKNHGIVSIEEISNKKKMGFGEAHNFAFKKLLPKNYFLIINPDVYLNENCISKMIETIQSDQTIGIVEARQMPFEHPKEYDKKTKETPWASGFGMLINSVFFEKVNGFDEKFWMYCEDVDLSWRAWINDYRVVYNPLAAAYHFTGTYSKYRNDRYYLEHFWSARNFLYLAYKFFGNNGADRGIKIFENTPYPKNFKNAVMQSFQELKTATTDDFFNKNRNKILSLNTKIKITGFNLYHETRN